MKYETKLVETWEIMNELFVNIDLVFDQYIYSFTRVSIFYLKYNRRCCLTYLNNIVQTISIFMRQIN